MDATAFLEHCSSKGWVVIAGKNELGHVIVIETIALERIIKYVGLSFQNCIDEILDTPFFKDMSITESLQNVPEKDSYLMINDVMKYIPAFSLERGDYVLNMGYVAHIAPYRDSEIIIHTKDVSNPECFMTSGKLVKHNSLILAIKSQDLCKIDKSLLV